MINEGEREDEEFKMREKVKLAVITGGFSVLAAAAGAAGTTAYHNRVVSTNENSNTFNVTIDGANQSVTADKYIALFEENSEMRTNISVLESKIDELMLGGENREYDSPKAVNTENTVETQKMISMQSKLELKKLTVVDSNNCKEVQSFIDSYGNHYDTGYELWAFYNGYIVYSLKGEYSSFEGCVVAGPDTASDASMKLQIYCDDELIDTISPITKITETLKIGPYDVRNARRLEIRAVNERGYQSYLYLVDAFIQ